MAVEIARRVIADSNCRNAPAIVDQRLRMEDQPVERHAVNKRLQRRSRRAHRPRHIERAAARRRAEHRHCRHGRARGARGCRRRSRRASRSRRARRLRGAAGFRAGAAAADRSSCAALCGARRGVAQPARQMRRMKRQGQPARGTGSPRASARICAEMMPFSAIRRSTRSRAARAASGCRSGRSRSGERGIATSKRRLGRREPGRFLAEIGEARGPHSLEIAAERRQGQVEARTSSLGSRRSRPSALAISTSFAASVRGRRSSSRTVCIVNVEAPETMWPMSHEAGRRRAASRRDRRRDGCRSAHPRRRPASGDRADRRDRAASGRRHLPSAVRKPRRIDPSRARTRTDRSRLRSSAGGGSISQMPPRAAQRQPLGCNQPAPAGSSAAHRPPYGQRETLTSALRRACRSRCGPRFPARTCPRRRAPDT